jgi:MFS transporter, ACS family, hexuronate transporter
LLLLLATMVNYMDRQVLANMSVRITEQLKIRDVEYGNIEWAFGTAFAFGSLAFGFAVDRVSVRWLYPAVLLAWSAIGFLTGFVWDYSSLLVCRSLLGFLEAGHWPCAMIVTYTVLSEHDRPFGNSILQSGASLGAIITPIIIAGFFMVSQDAQAWRTPFQIVGLVGIFWAIAWCVAIPAGSLARSSVQKRIDETQNGFGLLLLDRRFWALVIMIIAINTSWQLIRAWMPKFLQQGRGYSESSALYFNSAYYLATDLGCIGAGIAARRLARHGMNPHKARLVTYGGCAVLAGFTCLAACLPQGGPLLVVLLVVGAGTLGLFPCYYSFTQELCSANLGKATGTLAFLGWIASSPVHRFFGAYVDKTGSFDLGIALVGLAPLLGLVAMLTMWPREAIE